MPNTQNVTAAWQKRAPWLARWTLAHMANRTDLWGRYLAKDKRKTIETGQTVLSRLAPLEAKRGKLKLSEKALARHYRGEDPGDLLGVQSAAPNNTSRWIAVDLESHHEKVIPLNNLRAGTHWRDELISMGFRPLLIDSDGKGGYHLLVFFRQALPTAKAHEFARTLVRDHADLGLEHMPVILPNGASSDDNNWLRLPGRHPVTDHWSRVWNGRRWLEGSDAVEALLHAHGDSATLIRKLTAGGAAAPSDTVPASAIELPPRIMPSAKKLNAEPTIAKIAAPKELNRPPTAQLERQILTYLFAAARQDQEAAAFGAVAAADVEAGAFLDPLHKQILVAMESLYLKSQRITPTVVAEQLPEADRPAALKLIDQVIVEKPVDEDEFEDVLAALADVRRKPAETPAISGVVTLMEAAVVEFSTASRNQSEVKTVVWPSDAESGAASTAAPAAATSAAISDPADSDFEILAQSWPALSPAIRQAILAIAKASRPA